MTLLDRSKPGQFVHGSCWWWQSRGSFSSPRTGQGTSLCGGHEPVVMSGVLQGYKVYGERAERYPPGRDTSARSPPPCNTMLPNRHPNKPCLVMGLSGFKESTVPPRSRAARRKPQACRWLAEFPSGIPWPGSTPQSPHRRTPRTLLQADPS